MGSRSGREVKKVLVSGREAFSPPRTESPVRLGNGIRLVRFGIPGAFFYRGCLMNQHLESVMKIRFLLLALTTALSACGTDSTPLDPSLSTAIAPACSNPAPLHGTPHPKTAGSYIVVYHDAVDVQLVTARFAKQYGFKPKYVYQHALRGFATVLSAEMVAGIRCEPEVNGVSHDSAGKRLSFSFSRWTADLQPAITLSSNG